MDVSNMTRIAGSAGSAWLRVLSPAFCALSIACIPMESAGAATINNAGFESGMSGWTEVDPAAISGVAYSGSNSLKIDGSPARVHQDVSVNPNTEYTLSAYVLGEGQIGVNDNNGLFKNKAFNVSQWAQVSTTFTTNSGTTSLEVFAKHYNNTESVRFDDFTLVETGSGPSGPTHSTNARIQAESHSAESGTQVVSGRDGGDVVGYINNGDSTTYAVDVVSSGSATVSVRVASQTSGGTINFILNGSNIGSVSVPGTGGWNQYTTVTGNVTFPSTGNKTLVLQYSGGSGYLFDINWFEFGSSGSGGSGCTPIPSLITDGSLWDLEGDNPHPLVDACTLEFVPLEAQVTTPNGHGWRHEYKIKSSERVAMTDVYEDFQATIKVDMSTGGKTIVAQHHASDTGTIMKLYVADSSESGFFDSTAANGIFDVYVRIRNTSGVEEKAPLGTIQSGDSFTFRVINDYGVVEVEAFGLSLETEVEDDSASYLKFGNYLQSQYPNGSVDCGEPGDSDSFEQCYDDIGITESKITMTNVSYTRIEN